MQEYCLLQAVSGQHKHIGQGGTIGNAKRGSDEEWEEASPESLTPNPSPKGEGSDYPSYNAWEEQVITTNTHLGPPKGRE